MGVSELRVKDLVPKYLDLVAAVVHEVVFDIPPDQFLAGRAKEELLKEYEALGLAVVAYRRYSGGIDVVLYRAGDRYTFMVRHSLGVPALRGGVEIQWSPRLHPLLLKPLPGSRGGLERPDTSWHPYSLRRGGTFAGMVDRLLRGELEWMVRQLAVELRMEPVNREAVLKLAWAVRIVAKLYREAGWSMPMPLPRELAYVREPVPSVERLRAVAAKLSEKLGKDVGASLATDCSESTCLLMTSKVGEC